MWYAFSRGKGGIRMAKNDHIELVGQMQRDTPDELWDIYDAAGSRTGRLQRRGDPLAPGDCHLCVHVWIQNADGRYLLTRRAPEKSGAGLWEITGGSALAGEDSLTAALREVKEETGLTLDPGRGELLFRFSGEHYHCDVWRFRQEVRLADVVLQPGETCDAQLADAAAIRALNAARLFLDFEDLERVLELPAP